VWAIDANWLEEKYRKDNEKLTAALDKDPHMSQVETFDVFDGNSIILRITPLFLHDRLSVQQGCFLMSGSPKMLFMDNLIQFAGREDLGKYLYKYKIPYGDKIRQEFLGDLFRMNISRASLFPGLDGFATSFRTSVYSKPELLSKRAFLERIKSDHWAWTGNL